MAGALVFILILAVAAVALYRRSVGGGAAFAEEISRALGTDVVVDTEGEGTGLLVGPFDVPDGVELRGRALEDPTDRAGSITTGDGPFDRWIAADGDRLQVVTWLDEDRRRTLRTHLRESDVLIGGFLRLTLESQDGLVARAVALAEALRRSTASPLDALCATAREDRSNGVRATALELLAEHFADSAQATQTARRVRDDNSSRVRAAAALFLAGVDGPEALRDLALDPVAEVEHRRMALSRLLEDHRGRFAPEICTAWAVSTDPALRKIAEGWVGGGLSVAEPAATGMLSETQDQGAVSVFELDYSEEQGS